MKINFKSLMENVFDFKFQFAPFYNGRFISQPKIGKPLAYSKGVFKRKSNMFQALRLVSYRENIIMIYLRKFMK